mgnify:CR=1 FL=1
MTKFFIDLHGCAKNQVDAEIIATYLKENGYEAASNAEEADLLIINSCGFIESAKEESINAVIEAKKFYPGKKIILAGCLAERYADQFSTSLKEADGICGNGDLSKIVSVCDSVMKDNRPVEKEPQKYVCAANRNTFYGFKKSAYVKITEGCSNHCSFCAIPIIRGELRSRPAGEIVSEIRDLVSNGFYEINLIGQDLAAYGTGACDKNLFLENEITDGASPLSVLLEKISELEGKFIVRLLYIHPDHFIFDILDVMKKDSRFLHYFDIPFQSGSDKLILSMNRKGSFESYKKMIDKMREILPDMVLRTTFMTGFPGETKKDFLQTLEFLKAIRPSWSGCFSYSLEEDTPAENFRHRVSHRKALKRQEILEAVQEEITSEKLQEYVGKEYDVLIEEIISADITERDGEKVSETSTEGLAIGRAWFQAPDVDGAVVVRYETDERTINEGDVVRVKILSVSGVDLDGVALRASE